MSGTQRSCKNSEIDGPVGGSLLASGETTSRMTLKFAEALPKSILADWWQQRVRSRSSPAKRFPTFSRSSPVSVTIGMTPSRQRTCLLFGSAL